MSLPSIRVKSARTRDTQKTRRKGMAFGWRRWSPPAGLDRARTHPAKQRRRRARESRRKSQSSVHLGTKYKPTPPLTTISSTGWASPSTMRSSYPPSLRRESAANHTKKSATTSAKIGNQTRQNPDDLFLSVDQRFVGLAHLNGLCYHPAYG